jgi:hypothetical protein
MRRHVYGFMMLALLSGGDAQTQDTDWIADDRQVLEMLLAHRDADRVDGGTLRVDRERRVVAWRGAPNEIGCRRPWEASFDDVEDVRVDEPGFVLRLRSGARKEVRLAPLPHFSALIDLGRTHSVAPVVKEALRGPDKDGVPLSGSGSSTTPTLERPVRAPEVQRDSRRAVDALRHALGRSGP